MACACNITSGDSSPQKEVNLNNHPSFINIGFKGFSPEPHLRKDIKALIDLIRESTINKICILTHTDPDCDAYGSAFALANSIKEGSGKNPDVVVMEPLNISAKFLDPEHEIKIIKELGDNKNINSIYIKEKLGDYDLVIVTDTPTLGRLDKPLKEAIIDPIKNNPSSNKKIVKIDHHLIGDHDKKEDYYFGDINIIDTGKEAAAQIVMQCIAPLGISTENLNPKISNAIAAGIISDSANFNFPRGQEIFKDAAKLSKTSNMKNIAQEVNKLSTEEFKLFRETLNNIQFVDNGEIAYMVVDENKTKIPVKNAVIAAICQIARIETVKYYFAIIKNTNPAGTVSVSLRSKDKSILELASFFGGGGHARSSGFTAKIEDADELANKILEKIRELKNSKEN